MIVRIVRFKVLRDKEPQFRELFAKLHPVIENCNGCLDLQMCASIEAQAEYLSISRWASLEDLRAYRNSTLFRETIWPQVKTLLSDKAWVQNYEIVPASEK